MALVDEQIKRLCEEAYWRDMSKHALSIFETAASARFVRCVHMLSCKPSKQNADTRYYKKQPRAQSHPCGVDGNIRSRCDAGTEVFAISD